jgi:hypothetical protein
MAFVKAGRTGSVLQNVYTGDRAGPPYQKPCSPSQLQGYARQELGGFRPKENKAQTTVLFQIEEAL